jgi:hypothetical protein
VSFVRVRADLALADCTPRAVARTLRDDSVGCRKRIALDARIDLMTDERFDVPLYSALDVDRYLDVPVSTFRTWAHGYERRPNLRAAARSQAIRS